MSNDKPVRYFEWDFPNNRVTEYRRLGECNGCGQCCAAVVSFEMDKRVRENAPKTFDRGRRKNFSFLSNGETRAPILHEVIQGTHRRQMTPIIVTEKDAHRCSALLENQRCALHQFKNWKKRILELCDVWPIHPSHVSAFDQCSYTFEVVQVRAINNVE